MSKLRLFFVRMISILIILALAGGIFGFYTVRQSFPQVDGRIHIQGLDGPVDIYRDAMGIPQVYATTQHDLFMAQGYTHAQERFWQMDFWRHIGAGTLSEMFGKSELDTDMFLRTLGWREIAEQEYQALDPESRSLLDAYAEGVNDYLSTHQGTTISLEYGVLKLLNPGYQPAPWTPINTLTWAKVMAWDLRGNIDEEIERSILLKTLTPDQVNELFPPYPADHPTIVQQYPPTSAKQPDVTQILKTPNVDVDLSMVADRFNLLDGVLGPSGSGIGSNSWVISGKLTTTGKPLLANDPHLAIQMPSIWYQMGLHCQPVGTSCPYDLSGFSFAGVPGIVIGHNERIAWGFTNVGPDVMDLYIEKINPDNPNQYEVDGKWVDMQTRIETINVAGDKPVTLTVRSTRHGPIISGSFGPLKDQVTPTQTPYSRAAGIPLPQHYAISLRWTALKPGFVFRAIWGFDKAQNWNDFRAAAKYFTAPGQNLVYADVDGNIGYQMPGNVPIRKQGDGRLPAPGWTDDYEWTGYIPFNQLPYTFNPPQGYIVTANNRVPPANFPYLITTDWEYGYRALRIQNMIEQAPGKIDIAYIEKMQGDDKDLNAATLVPILNGVQLSPQLANLRYKYLSQWDYQDTMDSPSAALFAVFWQDLLKDTFSDEPIPAQYMPDGGERWFEVMRKLVSDPTNSFWDDKTTPNKVETRDDIFAKAFAEAVNCQVCIQKFGSDISKWQWGGLHTATFRNQSLGESGVAPIEALFNRGPYPTSGGKGIVNATGWTAGDSFEVDWLPSMRMIVDLSNLDHSLTVHTTGESGHAFNPHYADMIDLWRNIQYYPMLWSQQQVTDNAKNHLQLLP